MKIDLKDQVMISPALPLRRVSTYNGSALPLEFVNVPAEICRAAVVAVEVSVTNADGAAISAPCTLADGEWRVIFAASHFAHYGFVERGVCVTLTLREGEGAADRDLVFAVGDLDVMRASASATPGDPSRSYQGKGDDIYVKTRLVGDVQHYAKQTVSYDEDMGAWGAEWTGDYILADGEFVPYESGSGSVVAPTLLALLIALPFAAGAITATKEYVDRKDAAVAVAATNYTDAAVAAIPAPDYTTNNVALTNTIAQVAPAHGDYAAVSNAAMSAAAATNDFLRTTGGSIRGSIRFSYFDDYGVEIGPNHPGALVFRSSYPEYADLQANLDLSRISPDEYGYGFAEIAFLSDIPESITPAVVTNIVRDLSSVGIWDSELEVWWTPRMRNGSLTYEATTNVNLNAEN